MGGQTYEFGAAKSALQWINKGSAREWTGKLIMDAIEDGKVVPAANKLNPANAAFKYIHPTTGQGVVIDDVTKTIIHLEGPAGWFK